PSQKIVVTDSVHDAELSAMRMLLGLSMGLKQGINHGEYAATLLASMAMEIQKANQRGMATAEEIAGMQIVAGQAIDGQLIPGNGAANHIQILAQNKESKTEVKKLSDALGKLLNEVKGFEQRLQEAQGQAQQNGNGAIDLEAAAKAKATLMQAEIKRQNTAVSHAEKTRQKAESHQQKLKEKATDAELQRALEMRKAEVEEAVLDLTAAGDITRKAAEPVAKS